VARWAEFGRFLILFSGRFRPPFLGFLLNFLWGRILFPGKGLGAGTGLGSFLVILTKFLGLPSKVLGLGPGYRKGPGERKGLQRKFGRPENRIFSTSIILSTSFLFFQLRFPN